MVGTGSDIDAMDPSLHLTIEVPLDKKDVNPVVGSVEVLCAVEVRARMASDDDGDDAGRSGS